MTSVSVLMPAYNAGRFVAEAVESILAQRLADFEFVIVDDGSTDDSPAILRRYAERDRRIRLIRRPNTGIVGALNDGLAAARGELVARMDADDVALPDRLAVQVDYLRRHPECLAVGCMADLIDEDGEPLGSWALPLDHEEIDAINLLGHQAIIHPAVVFRRDAVLALGGYRPHTQFGEDLDLFLRLGEVGRLANVPETLLKFRRHNASIVNSDKATTRAVSHAVVCEARRRRGLAEPPRREPLRPAELSQAANHRLWAWGALKSGNLATARKHAWRSLRTRPFAVESWRVVYCSLRGR